MGYFRFVLFLFATMLVASAGADEYIDDFHSDITIAADGSMEVTETIRVRAEGVNIRRGIYRDFPTRYPDRFGNRYNVSFEVVGVTRDGLPEVWNAYRYGNGVRVDLGTDEFLAVPREYEYAIRYRTDRQLGFFADHDELYWNVTGNGWGFDIDAASATVRLPSAVNANQLTMEGYTGPYGARTRDYAASRAAGVGMIRTTRMLPPFSGLTLVFSFPKGIVREPTRTEKLQLLLRDNRGVLIALLALVAVVTFLVRTWSRVGRDPNPGVIFPHYEPPAGISPAVARYVMQMGYDGKALTATMISLAVKGHLHITQQGSNYTLQRQHTAPPPTADEQRLLDTLLGSRDSILLDRANHLLISAARSAHATSVRSGLEGRYFVNNSGYLGYSLVVTAFAFGIVVAMQALVPLAVGVFVLILLVHAAFAHLLRAPTLAGRKLMDQLEGFKLYLDVAEKEEMNLRNPPELTPELFERYLPYAIALGVEHAWSERFERALAVMQQDIHSPYRHYHPLWYTGHFNAAHLGDFSRSVGSSFNSAISSAATAPGSHSGGGGGGFSGGGGGGGGGGGR